MSLTIPLAVRLVTERADRHITRELRDLSFRDVAVGGWASARLMLDRPLILQPDEVAYYGRVVVHDGRTGATVWEGRLEDPGRGAHPDGQVWDLTAMGPSAHAQDRTVPLVYIDRSLERWEPHRLSSEHAQADRRVDTDANDKPVLWLTAPRGTSWAQGATCSMVYRAIRAAGLKLGHFNVSGDCGKSTTDIWKWRTVTRSPGGTGTVGRDLQFTTAGIAASQAEVVDSFPDGDDQLELRIEQRSATAQTPDDDVWAIFANIYVGMKLMDVTGTELGASYNYQDGFVQAHEVVADLLGRLLTEYDGAGATIATTSYAIDQLAYVDGANPARVLDDLMRLEPGYRWGAYETNAAGKHRFEWTAWPTMIRYEADVVDGFVSPGSADGLFNAVRVRWRDPAGAIKMNRRTSTVAELTAAGLTREAMIDLGDEIGATTTNADRAGDQFLAEHAAAPNAGRLVIARPILDLTRGRMVMPWEIKAGELIRVRGVLPRANALNTSTRDGVTVFRIWSREYFSSTAAAVLELDSPSDSTARALATLQTQTARRR